MSYKYQNNKYEEFLCFFAIVWWNLFKFHVSISSKLHYTEPKTWNVNPLSSLNMRFLVVYTFHSTDKFPPNITIKKTPPMMSHFPSLPERNPKSRRFSPVLIIISIYTILLHLFNVYTREAAHVHNGFSPANDINPYSLIESISSTRKEFVQRISIVIESNWLWMAIWILLCVLDLTW